MALIKIKDFINKMSERIRIYKQLALNTLAIVINKAQNLAKTNYDLGIYHLNNGNIVDAKLRFNMVKNILGGFPNINYHLARCYIYEQNFKKAFHYLALDEPLAKYRRQVLEHKEIKYIPPEVIIEDYNFHANFENLYSSSFPLINSILSNIIELKEVISFTRILDLGCGRGNFGIAINKTFTHSFHIDALDVSLNMINYCKTLKDNKGNLIYNNFFINDFRNFQIEDNNKYNLIIANFSLHYSLDLAENLRLISNFLTKNGFILITLYTTQNTTSFDYKLQNFCYNEEFIRNCAEKNNLDLIQIHHSTMNENKNIVYCALKTN